MHPWQESRGARLIGPAGLIVGVLVGVAALAWVGHGSPETGTLGVLTVAIVTPTAAVTAVAYLLGAFGLGRLPAWLLMRRSASRVWAQLALGVALMLFVSHGLGVLGLLSGEGALPRVVGWGIVGLGLVLLAEQIARGELRPETWPVLPRGAILWAPAIALLLVAATNPPGPLWGSEHGAYDVRSYHLQLPKEWAAGERLWPAEHNVYSFLPSYVEAAYLHLGALSAAGGGPLERMMGGEAVWVLSCQLLHAGLAIVTALLVARTAWMVLLGTGIDPRAARFGGAAAGAVLLGIPWVVVVGSMAYNEMAVTALCAGGLLVALDAGARPLGRGIAAGFLVGVACSAKPTALFMVGPVVGVALLGRASVLAWPGMIGAGAAAGLLAMAPWLARNWLAGGNPVFPFATGLFGTGHWTEEQVARYARAHAFEGGLGDRLALLFSDDRGLLHPQWSIVPQLVAVSIVLAIAWRPARRVALLLSGGVLAQLVAWMAFTHLQPRFLAPVAAPASLLFGLAGGALLLWSGRAGTDAGVRNLGTLARAIVAVVPLCAAGLSVLGFLGENGGAPNALLPFGPGERTGMAREPQLEAASPREAAEILERYGDPEPFVNLVLRPQAPAGPRVYLLGDGAPLYYLGALGEALRDRPGGVIYHTTWDTSPLGEAIRGAPENPAAWSGHLRERLGVDFVLVNAAEMQRLVVDDGNYDPAVTQEAVSRWLAAPEAAPRLLRTWIGPTGVVVSALYELPPVTSSERSAASGKALAP